MFVCVCEGETEEERGIEGGGRGRKGSSPGYSNGQRRLLRRDKTDEALGRHWGLWSSADKNTPQSLAGQRAHAQRAGAET